MACEFVRRFVTGTAAGAALLEARQELLAKKNPLGLVYTLFASAELRFGTKSANQDPVPLSYSFSEQDLPV
jgi:hypothetical protein